MPNKQRKSVKKRTSTKSKDAAANRRVRIQKRTTTSATAKAKIAARTIPVSDATQENLNKIEHIVVLVMENRSFDHMLGYLKLEGGRNDIDGLTADMFNDYKGTNYPVHHLTQTALGKNQDPCHKGTCVTEQMSNANGGFVSNYAGTHPDDPEIDLVMGYYNGSDLPVYDHLSRNFIICDRWFCSVDGSTWPNRLYAVTGRASGSKNNKSVPIYNLPSFARHLNKFKVSWRWYAHDISTLRITDAEFRVGHFKHFSYFDKHSLLGGKSFLQDAASGKLAAVSWIDPNFVDFSFIGPSGSNDDHPPSDVMSGQELVLKLYNAVISSPQWNKTLLVIVYDEHGGFFDHVAAPPAEDDSPSFRHYGLRVPAIVVSSWVERGKVSSTLFDHTSIIKTILLRFCQNPDGSIPDMGARVNHANHLGELLTLTSPRPATPVPAFQHLIERVANWRASAFRERMMLQSRRMAPEPPKLNELQQGVLKAKAKLRAKGLPEGQP